VNSYLYFVPLATEEFSDSIDYKIQVKNYGKTTTLESPKTGPQYI
jgi:hypothetical protein